MKLKEWLCKLSGDDYTIIRTCDIRLQNRFIVIGAFVFLIFVLCFVSSYFTFTQLFQSYLIGIPAGLFFATMITNIYLLLLYTLSKHMLPHNERFLGRRVSLIIRLVFIGFIAIVVSKPIEVLLFSFPLNGDVAVYKQEERERFERITNEFFDSEIIELRTVIQSEILSESPINADRLARYEARIVEKNRKREELLSKMREIVAHSNYYIRSIVILNTNYRVCWFVTAVVVMIFFLPAYLKKVIPATGRFYARKGEIEKGLIEREYATFKENYSHIFNSLHNAEIQFVETFEDPPYNTVPKTDKRKFFPEDHLISELYNA